MASIAIEKTKLKEEGAREAAKELNQDSQSKVSPEKSEKAMVPETNKAGLPVFKLIPLPCWITARSSLQS